MTRNLEIKSRELLPIEIPAALRKLGYPPRRLSIAGDFSPASLCVAIVGSREATPATIHHTRQLAAHVVAAGGVVISGGANGTDAAAHRGTIDAGGRTWCVLGCGSDYVTPPDEERDDRERFTRIVDNGGAILWPFPPDAIPASQRFKSRNRVIMSLAQIAVVAQADAESGSMNAASHARDLGKELWVVPGIGKEFAGSWKLIEGGARPLWSEEDFIARLRRTELGLEGDALKVFNALGSRAKHPDELAVETGLSTPAVTTALLTLALGDVVVEGSAGLYQRK